MSEHPCGFSLEIGTTVLSGCNHQKGGNTTYRYDGFADYVPTDQTLHYVILGTSFSKE